MYPGVGVSSAKSLDDAVYPRLMDPSLENRLRIVGRFIDARHLYSVALNEMDQGFLVRAYTAPDQPPVLFDFAAEHLSTMIQDAIGARGERNWARPIRPLTPTGYEDLLRAIGFALDQKATENVAITEFTSFITVCGFTPSIQSSGLTYQPFSDALDVSDVETLLETAVQRRGSYAPVTRYYPPNLSNNHPER